MVTNTLTLNHFSQPVPVCEQTANLETVLTTLQSGQHEMMVVVDQHKRPLGAIYCRVLISHLVDHWQRTQVPQIESLIFNLRSLMLPLATLKEKMSVDEFLALSSDKPKSNGSTYALVNEKGAFVGLLNSWSLLKSFWVNAEKPASDLPEWSSNRLNQFLQEFIEQFPLPIMLHNEQNQVIYQNHKWLEQIGNAILMGNMSVSPLSLKAGTSLNSPLSHYWWNSLPDPLSKIQAECLKESESLVAQFAPTFSKIAVEESVVQLAEQVAIASTEASSNTDKIIWQFSKIPLHFSDKCPKSSPNLGSNPLWLVLATDVTQQQQCSLELASKNADLVYLNRLKDEFLACISHELKSPLTAVVGLSSLLKEQKIGELNSRQAHYAELIYKSGRQLMTLVNDLLDLTRLETGQLKLNPTVVKIQRACQRAYESLQDKYKGKDDHINFSLDIEPDLEQLVIDELRLQQMLIHLLDNAIKFTPEGGEIGIRVSRWENWVAFTVWDTGIGIPEEFQHLIFQKFQQLESPLTRQFEGTGLGLVLTQRLAKAHGGDISFISKGGQGSQFTLLLPPHPLPKEDDTQRNSTLTQSCPIILVVESSARLINEITEQLTDLGYQVVIARTGTEALEKARQIRPHRIFLNPLLPLLSGWDVLTLLKSDPRTSNIKVIVTALGEHQIYSEQKGADGFVAFPVEKKSLQSILEQLALKTASFLKNVTILRLYPQAKPTHFEPSFHQTALDLLFSSQFSELNYRLLEADSLEQAEIMASVWKVDVVILDDLMTEDPIAYLTALSQCETISKIPLITLDATVTAAANHINNLFVFPCLIPKSENQVKQLLQVIQIAIES
jgi:signal transduction histidine kinase/CheY-like chemotaxis protein